MSWEHKAVKRVDIVIGLAVVLLLSAYLLAVRSPSSTEPPDSHTPLSSSGHLDLVRSTASCEDVPVEMPPPIHIQRCYFADAVALLWVFDDSVTSDHRHTRCSSLGPWAIVDPSGDLTFCLTNGSPNPYSTELREVGSTLVAGDNTSRFELLVYPDDGTTARSVTVFVPEPSRLQLLGVGIGVLLFLFLVFMWIPLRRRARRRSERRVLLDAITERLRDYLAAPVPTGMSERPVASAAAAYLPDTLMESGTIGELSNMLIAGTLQADGTAHLTPTRFMFRSNTHNYEVPYDEYALKVDSDWYCVLTSVTWEELQSSDHRPDISHAFYLDIFDSEVDKGYWYVMLHIAQDGDYDLSTAHSDDAEHLLKPYETLLG